MNTLLAKNAYQLVDSYTSFKPYAAFAMYLRYVDAYMQLKSYMVNIKVFCLVLVKGTQRLDTYLLKCLNENVQDFQI